MGEGEDDGDDGAGAFGMSKGGKQTTEVEIPEWLEAGGKDLLARAQEQSRIGYMPYYGPEVAALTGQQMGAMQNTQSAAQAFGMAAPDPMAGMPQAQDFGGGVMGYSSGPLFDKAKAELAQRNPGQFAAYEAQFIDPVTGKMPGAQAGAAAPAATPAPTPTKRTSEADKDRGYRAKGYKLGDTRRGR
jgi:hypothetical protein